MVACGKAASTAIVGLAEVTDRRGASMACCIVMPWSMKLSVTLSTELMIVAPPGEPYATSGSPSAEKIIAGVMLLRGRLAGCTSL